ncbi:MAG: protein kinase [Bryobacterales bacterium]|nr:protein kinase [Bryobacterales bacterium]
MPIPAGDKLGPYQIIAPIGAGGMGEVYRARDTRLNRDVAIKVLPAAFAQDTDRQRRFTQEAQSAGALNHPNILAIYDTGTHEGMPYLVSELLEGQTLRQRLDGGKLPLAKVIDYAQQIASGLAAAHAKGITHRDIKPDNLFVNKDGILKILDFGLAKQASPASPTSSGDATRTAVSEPGMVMGTAGYMSPEQVKGLPADARSDLFSFGVVLYEMVSGEKAFRGDTAVEAMHAILKHDPPEVTPPQLESVVRHCLEKDPDQRFQSARDLVFAMRQLSVSTGREKAIEAAVNREPARAQGPREPWRLAAIVGALMLATAVATIQFVDEPRLDLSTVKVTRLASEFSDPRDPSWAPDGTSYSFSARGKGLLIRSLSSDSALPVGVRVGQAVHSRDGQRLYYSVGGVGYRTVWSVSLSGGQKAQLLQERLPGFEFIDGLAESPDGKALIVAQELRPGYFSLWSSSPPGNTLERLSYPEFEAQARIRLRFSPNGKRLAVLTFNTDRSHALVSVMPWPPKNEARRTSVLTSVKSLLGSGPLVDGDWMEDSRNILAGLPIGPVVINTDTGKWTGLGQGFDLRQFAGSRGRFLATDRRFAEVLVELPLDGSPPRRLLEGEQEGSAPNWSAAGDRMVYASANGLWIRTPGQSSRRLPIDLPGDPTDDTPRLNTPVFSPDASRIAFSRRSEVFIVPATGGNAVRVSAGSVPVWSPDGQWLALRLEENGKHYLAKISLGVSPQLEKLHELVPAVCPAWSPDGKHLTLATGSGLAIIEPDGKNLRVLVPRPTRAFSIAAWSRDSKTLFLIEPVGNDSRLTAVDVLSGKERTLGVYPDTLFGTQFVYSNTASLTPDGKSLATTMPETPSKLYLIEGLNPPTTFWQRLFARPK